MFETGLPSLQVAEVWSHPLGSVSETEYPEPGATPANVRVFDSVPSASSSSEKLLGVSPPPAVKEKSCGSSGVAFFTITIVATLLDREGAGHDLAGREVDVRGGAAVVTGGAARATQPLGTAFAASEYPVPTVKSLNVLVFSRAGSESSSRLKLVGDSPPPAVNEKSCASFGCESSCATMLPRFWFVKVQVTFSLAPMFMAETGLPSLHVALDWSQPAGTVSETEYTPTGVLL